MRARDMDEEIDFSQPCCVYRSDEGDLVYTQESPAPIQAGESWEIWDPIGSGVYVGPAGSVMNINPLPGGISSWRKFRLWLSKLIAGNP